MTTEEKRNILIGISKTLKKQQYNALSQSRSINSHGIRNIRSD